MQRIVAAGEIEALVPERVWKETERALGEARPDVFFETLRDCGALAVIFPELDALFGVPQPAQWHPEIDTGVHVMMALRLAARISDSTVAVRFAVLTHDLGKARTPQEKLAEPSRATSSSGVRADRSAVARGCKVPNDFRDLALLVSRHHTHVHRALELQPATLLKLLEETRCVPPPGTFRGIPAAPANAMRADALGLEERPYPQADYLRARASTRSPRVTLDEARPAGPRRRGDRRETAREAAGRAAA